MDEKYFVAKVTIDMVDAESGKLEGVSKQWFDYFNQITKTFEFY